MVVLAVNAWDESKGRVSRYVRKEKLKQRFLMDGSELWETQYDGLVPQVVWIDREGIIVDRHVGFDAKTSPGSLDEKTRLLVETK